MGGYFKECFYFYPQDLFHPMELMILVVGNQVVDWTEMEKVLITFWLPIFDEFPIEATTLPGASICHRECMPGRS